MNLVLAHEMIMPPVCGDKQYARMICDGLHCFLKTGDSCGARIGLRLGLRLGLGVGLGL